MKQKYRYLKQLGILIIFFWTFVSFGQKNYKQSLKPYLNPELIKENKIKSLVVYSDINLLNSLDEEMTGAISCKLFEFEFDSNGLQIYSLTSIKKTEIPNIEYGKGSSIELNEFDKNCMLISSYSESFFRSTQFLYKYDSKDRKTSMEHISNNDSLIKISFEWKKNKMINTNIIYSNKIQKTATNFYDTNGRVIKSIDSRRTIYHKYDLKNDTLYTTRTTFKNDSILLFTTNYVTLLKFDRKIKYVVKDKSNLTKFEMNAKLDENGNAYHYSLKKNGNIHLYKINNIYNEKSLLVKRLFYVSNGQTESYKLEKIERYFYDTDILPSKIKKGTLLEHPLLFPINDN